MSTPRPGARKRILVVDDEVALTRGLAINLRREGYEVVTADSGEGALDLALRHMPDLIVLDVMLPGLSGLDVCRELRHRGLDVPIVFLTARTEETDRVLGLELGADDYVVKPFGLRELLARIRLRLRRAGERPTELAVYRFGDVHLDFGAHAATRDGAAVDLTSREFELLRLLVRHRGQVVSRDRILDEVWGYDAATTTRTVDNFVLRLRQKLEPDPSAPRYILTVYGAGYKFVG